MRDLNFAQFTMFTPFNVALVRSGEEVQHLNFPVTIITKSSASCVARNAEGSTLRAIALVVGVG